MKSRGIHESNIALADTQYIEITMAARRLLMNKYVQWMEMTSSERQHNPRFNKGKERNFAARTTSYWDKVATFGNRRERSRRFNNEHLCAQISDTNIVNAKWIVLFSILLRLQ